MIAKDGIRWLEIGGPVLGLLPAARYEYETVTLAPGDLVIVCSDGVTEARSVTNEEFGRDRMLDAVKSMHGAKPDLVLDQLLSAVNQFARGAPQADDITVLVFRYQRQAGRRQSNEQEGDQDVELPELSHPCPSESLSAATSVALPTDTAARAIPPR